MESPGDAYARMLRDAVEKARASVQPQVDVQRRNSEVIERIRQTQQGNRTSDRLARKVLFVATVIAFGVTALWIIVFILGR